MVTNIPFPSFKNSDWIRKNKKITFVFIVLLAMGIVVYENVMLLAVITLYVLGSVVFAFTGKNKDNNIFDWPEDEEE